MDYYLRTLHDRERRAIEEERVVDDLLSRFQERSPNYVLGIKSLASQQHPEAPILDQGLIDSLLSNDSANFLVRRALSTGLEVTSIQAEESQLAERRADIQAFLIRDAVDQQALFTQVMSSLNELEIAHNELLSNIRKTHADFVRQQYADAIRVTMQPVVSGAHRSLVIAGIIGSIIGFEFAIGLSLLGFFRGSRNV
jgi:hypothetical protein